MLLTEHPASAIDPGAYSLVEHNRNCRIWVQENPGTAAHGNVKTASELRRFFQTVYGEL